MSLEKGLVPKQFKISTIVPVPKVPNTNKLDQLRPINMLPFCEKVLEIVVYNQLIKFITSNNILYNYQSGFRNSHSCETALQLVVSDMKSILDTTGVGICAVFIDLKRAFETIDRHILLLKLKKYGFNGTVFNWLENYLSNRYQRTKLNSEMSNPQLNDIGVPQGSVLGPLLFILYINDLGNVLSKCKIHLFADDTLIYFYGEDFVDVVDTMNRELHLLTERFKLNKLKVNELKSKYMFIGNNTLFGKFLSLDVHIKLNNEKIEMVQEIKYLGFILDRELTFSKHVDYICRKIGKK